MRVRLLALTLLMVALGGGGALADRRVDKLAAGREHYEAALRLLELGKEDAAAEELAKAYELVGDPTLLYNIAQIYRQAGRYEKAAQFYRSVLTRMGDRPDRAQIEGRIAEMEERIADQERQAARRKAEEQEQEARAARRASPQAQQDEGEARPVVRGVEPPPREAAVEPEPPAQGRSLKIAGYALCGLAGASLVVGITMSALVAQAKTRIEQASERGEVYTAELHDTMDRARVYEKVQIAGYVLAGAAAAGGAVAIYFGFRNAKEAQVSISPALGRGQAGLVLSGRF